MYTKILSHRLPAYRQWRGVLRGNVKKLKPYPLLSPRPGSIMEWYHKKKAIEDAGMKHVHAIEAYLTPTLSEKIRDNYHCVLIAWNYDGFWN